MKMDLGIRSVLAVAAIALAVPAAAVVPNQTDNFEDGSTQGWVVAPLGQPHPAPPANVATGGPAGTDDNYLLLTSLGGLGPGSRLVSLNLSQWAGNYTAAGVSGISLDLRNQGNTDLHIRLLFEDPTSGPPTNVAMTEDVYLPAGGGWTTVAFGVNAGSLIPVLGSVPTLLTNVTAIRIFSGVGAVFPPEPIAGQLGVDNIHALGAVGAQTETWSAVKAMFE